MDLPRLLERGRTSKVHRWLLNIGLRWSIPFNKPHGFRVVPLLHGGIRVEVPYRRANRNHIRGIHACCLATAAELCTGLALIGRMDHGKYRLIMMGMQMDYHWQAKSKAYAEYIPSEAEVERHLLAPLRLNAVCLFTAEVLLRDDGGNTLATGRITWQLKPWGQVRTKV